MAIPWLMRPGSVSGRAKQGDQALRLDLNLGEALPQSFPQGGKIVLAIIEHAFGVIKGKQPPRREVGCNIAPENGRAEQYSALIHMRAQMIERGELFVHASRQAMQHVGEPDRIERREARRDRRQEIRLSERRREALEPLRGTVETIPVDIEQDEAVESPLASTV